MPAPNPECASSKPSAAREALAERVDALLPQTQCGRCGYPACRPYAAAIASCEAPINRCPPGGADGLAALAQLLGIDAPSLDPSVGEFLEPVVAVIDETACIGCARCLPVCPTDAIVGAARHLHTVLAGECTGCARCLAVCPVDCIRLEAIPRPDDADRERFRIRHQAHEARLARERTERARALQDMLGGLGAG